ncbi:MAG: hypothetical protein IJS75_07925 [Bacteroidales bacterium]|nr:hypothetical protein [Bacteroidales bacterium]
MKRTLQTLIFALLLSTGQHVYAQFAQEFAVYDYSETGFELIRAGKISEALKFYANTIDNAKANRTAGEGVPADLLGEYAYVLALNRDYEAALVNIERSRALNGKYSNFYASQILYLMGLDDAAETIGKGAIEPSGISQYCRELSRKYAGKWAITGKTPVQTLKVANALAAKGRFVQALAMTGELKSAFPKEPVVYVSESSIWEGMKQFEKASKTLETALTLMPSSSGNNERRQVYYGHLGFLKTQQSIYYPKQSWLKDHILGYGTPRLIVYAGASIMSGMTSVNGRFGLYTNSNFSASLNLGGNFSSGNSSFSIGLSGYKTFKMLILGLGITDFMSKGSKNSLAISPSFGVTFPDKSGNSSMDIMFGLNVPVSGGKFGYSISLGKTIYFDL